MPTPNIYIYIYIAYDLIIIYKILNEMFNVNKNVLSISDNPVLLWSRRFVYVCST